MSKTVGHVCRGCEQSFIGLTWRNGKVVIVGKCGFCGDQAFTPLDSAQTEPAHTKKYRNSCSLVVQLRCPVRKF